MSRFIPWALLSLTFVVGCDHDEGEVATAVPGLPGPLTCGSKLDADQLLPSDAIAVGFYDAARERRHAPRVSKPAKNGPRGLLPSAEIEAVRLGWIGLSAACNLDDDVFRRVWFAVDREHGLVVTVDGDGIGNEDNLRCIQRRLSRWEEDLADTSILRGDGCGVSFDYDSIHGFAPHDDLLVLGTREAVDRARATYNAGHANPPTNLMPPKRHQTYLWAAVDVPAVLDPDDIEAAMSRADAGEATAFINLRALQFEAELGRRFELSLGGAFGAEDDARAAEAVLGALIEAPPPWLPDWGLQLLSSLQLSRDATRVSVHLPLSRKDAYDLGLVPSKTEADQVPGFPWIALLLYH